MITSKTSFLSKYAEPDKHYDYTSDPDSYIENTTERTDIPEHVLLDHLTDKDSGKINFYNASALANHHSITHNVAMKLFDGMRDRNMDYLFRDLISNQKVPTKSLDHIYNNVDDDYNVKYHITKHPNASSEILDDYAGTRGVYNIPGHVMMHPNMKIESIKKIINLENGYTHFNALSNRSEKEVHHAMLDHKEGWDRDIQSNLAYNLNTHSSVLDRMLDEHPKNEPTYTIAVHPNLSPESRAKCLSGKYGDHIKYLAGVKNV